MSRFFSAAAMVFTTALGLAPLAGASSVAVADSGPDPQAAATQTSAPAVQSRNPRYRLRKSDTFDLVFAFSPEFNQAVAIQPDGFIALKLAGMLHAEGMTLPELTEKIKQAYAGILRDPVVTIELKDYDKPYFIASGELGKPGKYDLRSDLTLTQAVAVAGGFTQSSKHSQVVLFHPTENGVTEARLIDVKKMLQSRNLTEDVHLQPGDTIYVPQNRISKIQRYLPTSSLGLYANPTVY